MMETRKLVEYRRLSVSLKTKKNENKIEELEDKIKKIKTPTNKSKCLKEINKSSLLKQKHNNKKIISATT